MSLLTLLRTPTSAPVITPSIPTPPLPPGTLVTWRFVLCDVAGIALGELTAYDRTIDMGVSQPAVAQFRVNADDQMWPYIAAGDTNLKVYDPYQNLVLYGPVIGDEEVAEGTGATVKCSASDLSWFLTKRFVGKDTTGVGTTWTAIDSGEIMMQVLDAANADGDTGIQRGFADAFVPRTVTYLWKRSSDVLNELGAIEGSYEWALRYVDTSGGKPAVYLDLETTIGSDRSADVFFEYGTGRNNCSAYSRARTFADSATRVYAIGQSPTQVAVAYDAAAEYRGRLEDVLQLGDIGDFALLDALAAAHVAIRKDPRQVVSLTPAVRIGPNYGSNWFVGDVVTARVMINDVVRVNGYARIWGASVSVDTEGNTTTSVRLVPA